MNRLLTYGSLFIGITLLTSGVVELFFGKILTEPRSRWRWLQDLGGEHAFVWLSGLGLVALGLGFLYYGYKAIKLRNHA